MSTQMRQQLDEMIQKSLVELGCRTTTDIGNLFARLRELIDSEGYSRANAGARNESESKRICKEFRDWLIARKSGVLARIDDNWLKPVPRELKPDVGRMFNALREFINEWVEFFPKRLRIVLGERTTPEEFPTREAPRVSDLTLPGYRRPLGSIHPITQVLREIEDIFLGLGFRIETGPEVESVYYNFDALNIPESHPSRDDWDTLYVDERTVLRTHTSPVQIRAMERYGAPLYIIAPGKVYRHDSPDASHSPMFHQIEGLAVDRDITFADLKGTLDFFARKFFGEKIRTRFSPSFFPFTEPSGEVAISCVICDGQGCRTCKESGWVEVMGCGMVHPEVLRHGGIDPEQFTGWAFGLGVERYAMMKYGISDIQLFYQSDVRCLEQF